MICSILVVVLASLLFGLGFPAHAQSQANPRPAGAKQTSPAQSGAELLLRTRCVRPDTQGQCALWAPSLVELIARPEVYDGRRVLVIGFVNFEFEGNHLYLSRADWEHGVIGNRLWIDPPPQFESDWGPARAEPNRRYVIVEATFRAERRGHLGLASGALEGVSRLDAWRGR